MAEAHPAMLAIYPGLFQKLRNVTSSESTGLGTMPFLAVSTAHALPSLPKKSKEFMS